MGGTVGKRVVGRRALWSVSTMVLVIGFLLCLPAVAHAAGGGTIAAAPQLPIGATFVGGANAVNGYEYWRVTLAAGDVLSIDFLPINEPVGYGPSPAKLYVYTPSITDATLGTASDVASRETYDPTEFTWTAIGGGSWILKVHSSYGYQLTTSVKRGSFNQAAGGGTIAAAPELPMGATMFGGMNAVNGYEYWRVTLAAGDVLSIDFLPINEPVGYGPSPAKLYVYTPSITDATLGTASDVASRETYDPTEFTWTAIGGGSWILKVHSSYGYQLTTSVKRGSFNQAAGGGTIAAAPELPLGGTLFGGANAVDGYEFWRVTMAARDRLRIDYEPINEPVGYGPSPADLYIYNPIVTDFTLGDTSYIAKDEAYVPARLTWNATGRGSWILMVFSSYGYQLTPSVQHVFATKLLPVSGKRGAIITIRGRNFGAKRGTGTVTFGSVSCSEFVSWSATRIKCKVPAKAKFGKITVIVVTAGGTSNGETFKVQRQR